MSSGNLLDILKKMKKGKIKSIIFLNASSYLSASEINLSKTLTAFGLGGVTRFLFQTVPVQN